MCGRFTQTHSAEAIAEKFHLSEVPSCNPRYNIAPRQSVAAVVHPADADRHLKFLQWGLIPSWAKDPAIASKLINARSETVTEKPSFRTAFKRRRCLIVADGFYEWQRLEQKKQPFYFHLQEHQPFGFAGLWEHWQSPEGETIESCTILTTEANALLQQIHNRMPVILPPDAYDLWLDPDLQDPGVLQDLLHPYNPEEMVSYPVSTQVNRPTHESPACIEPMSLSGDKGDHK